MPRRVTGHNYPQQRKRIKKDSIPVMSSLQLLVSSDDEEDANNDCVTGIEEIDMNDISSDEWTESEEDD